VEVVVVGEDGTARSVIATSDATDPNRELWWAHTGCGGGNLGVVTRYWFRALPKAPDSVVTLKAEWGWEEVDERAFKQLICNYEEWCERNSARTSPYAALFSVLTAGRRQFPGPIELRALSIAGEPAEAQLDEHLSAVVAGVGVAHTRRVERTSWLAFALNPFPDLFAIGPGGAAASTAKLKIKDALLCRRHTDRQMAVLYHHLTRDDVSVGGGIGLATYGGRVNAKPFDATAASQRAAVLDTAYTTGWQDAKDEEHSVRWVREFYRDVFAETGGVPVPGASYDGALINHPDSDMVDPAWNTSGVAWHALYYKDNYRRLQLVKARWDPRNVFHHALSIRLPDGASEL
jgi:aclacinomycin oxidase